VRSFVVVLAASICGVLAWSTAARAADAVVVAPESVVRTAPFDVAPEMARIHAGDKLQADDQAQGAWRRVKLADGRYGLVHDADLQVTAAPPPSAPAAAAPPPSAVAAAPTPVGARVNVFEVAARAAPSPDAPAVRVFAKGSTLVVSTEVQNGWRRVELPDGRAAFVADAALELVAAPPASVCAPPAPLTPPASGMFGLMLELMPIGTLKASLTIQGMTGSAVAETAFAAALAPFADWVASPNVSLGVSPRVIFHVRSDSGSGDSATEIDLRARLTGRLLLSPQATVFGRFSPGYSIVSLPSSAGVSDPKGLVLDFSVGLETPVNPKAWLVVEIGYQRGFQSTSADGVDIDFTTNYLHLGVGLAAFP
jgi:SH3-like domain-containing protein